MSIQVGVKIEHDENGDGMCRTTEMTEEDIGDTVFLTEKDAIASHPNAEVFQRYLRAASANLSLLGSENFERLVALLRASQFSGCPIWIVENSNLITEGEIRYAGINELGKVCLYTLFGTDEHSWGFEASVDDIGEPVFLSVEEAKEKLRPWYSKNSQN